MDTLISGREYHLTDAQLALLASNLKVAAQRDSADLSPFGVNTSFLSDYTALLNSFVALPGDESFAGAVSAATLHKDRQRDMLIAVVQGIVLRVSMKFGDDSPEMLRLGASALHEQSDGEFLLTARRVRQTALLYLPQLGSTGLEQEMLDDLEQMNTDFENLLNAKFVADSERMQNTRLRIARGNELYHKVVQLTNIGKQVYKNTNYAKYADYIIYKDSSTAHPTVPQNLRYEDGFVRWDGTDSATSFQLWMRLSIESEGNEVFSGAEAEFAFALPNPAPTGVTAYFFKVRARNVAGFGEFSPELRVHTS